MSERSNARGLLRGLFSAPPAPLTALSALSALTALTALSALAAPPALAQPSPGWTPADSAYVWRFPRDHWSHPGYKTEWWYFTGHLAPEGSSGIRFGYQFTFFRIGLLSERPALASAWSASDLVMGHMAVTDLHTGRHTFSELLYRASPLLGGFPAPGDSLVGWSRGPAGTDGRWTLSWTDSGFVFAAHDHGEGIGLSLATAPAKPLVFQGPNGFSRKGAGANAASQYYSFTRLRTAGTVAIGGDTVPVTGTSWMDKEFGSNQLAEGQVGWDWFSLQLDDGRELMLYLLRRRDGSADFARGTLIDVAGRAAYLAREDWSVEVTGRSRSASTGAEYPARWRVTVPGAGLTLEIVPLVATQENVSRLVPGLAYWEGAVEVRDRAGRAVGRGYVELTGYAEGGRLPL